MPTPSDAPRSPSAVTAVVALRALGSGVFVGATAVSALLAVEFDFGVPRIIMALLMGFLGFAAASAGEGLVVLLRSLLRALFGRMRFQRGLQALSVVPPVPLGRIVGAFVYMAGDVLWPQSFLRQLMLPTVGEIAIGLAGLTATAVALARMDSRTRTAQAALLALPTALIIAFVLWFADPGFDDYVVAAPVRTAPATFTLEDPGARGPLALRTLTYGSGTSARRPEYGAAAGLLTTSVDGSKVFGGYGGLAASFFLPAGLVVTQLRDAATIVVDDGGRAERASTAARSEDVQASVDALLLRDGKREQGNRALRLTWDAGAAPAYEIVLSPEDVARWALTPAHALTFALASVPGATPPQRVVIELAAADGARARLALGAGAPLVHSLPAHLANAIWLDGVRAPWRRRQNPSGSPAGHGGASGTSAARAPEVPGGTRGSRGRGSSSQGGGGPSRRSRSWPTNEEAATYLGSRAQQEPSFVSVFGPARRSPAPG